ncbi:hypothetical protein BCON_0442g00060 [Botryotinia convoluta]|uniref:Uncharacterized protein n=1 Tax=Botryotinia convoluta TaxID=54673 RepID=A0A4Z1H709_9HELO|nr:hypothetical protein BCON_0442g00060 [Botryotinia convoluta]
MTDPLEIVFLITMIGTLLATLIFSGDWYKQRLKVELEMEVRAQVLRNLLHTPAEQRSTRVLDFCFFAVANSLISKEFGTNEPVLKAEDFNTLELRLHLAERTKESEAEVHGKIGIGSRSFVALTKMEEKQFVEAMKKLIEGWTMEIESDEECHLPGVHCSTGFEKEIKYIKKWIEEQSKEKVEEV